MRVAARISLLLTISSVGCAAWTDPAKATHTPIATVAWPRTARSPEDSRSRAAGPVVIAGDASCVGSL